MWVATASLPRSAGHPFYTRMNALLAEAQFDAFAEAQCAPYYAETQGRPSIPPGIYFRMLLVGYFEGIGSQRGIAWRCSDSLSLRHFLGIPPTGKAVSIGVIDIIRLADGKFVEHWGQMDSMGMMQQLGAIPTPGQSYMSLRHDSSDS